ncbi:serine/threonine-protein kinase [Streptomyces laculatispora]|uniref:serine/threonine-protein kinase n=1 Tax=Streptomyces laculatispora TaxID=887464 RepID=UPI001A951FEA|nr:serine/threonine-protein kinase [Streptomyces laculatispora]MBO0918598.1 serine/threonine protein kinase [Streptomyces laculatispora]
MQPLEAGEPLSIGAYRLLGRLGAGGMGRVYLGRSAGGRTVAVKVVHPHFALDEQFRARFRREVDAARRIGAQWTAPVLDADPDAPVPWVATGYVAGPPLSAAITEHGPLPEQAVRTLGAGLAEALTAVHEQGLIHRDVKPSNVLLALDGPRLIDFGIARAIDATASLTSTGVSVGSPGYMAPEQIRGQEISGAVDVFSLGAVLAYAATGAAPFLGDSSAVLLYKVVHEEPELGDLEGGLREVVASCLAKNPAHRPTPAELARQLAPGGAAARVAAGWLPGPLVREVSRSAVALLDLEPQEAPVQSGPVPFTQASFGFNGAGAAGVFGPPLEPLPAPPRHPPTETDGVPGQRTPDPRFAVSMNAGAGPGEHRGRRLSCTVALAVAGALAAVTVGSAYVFDLMPGGDGGNTAGHGDTAPTPGATASAEPSVPGDAATVTPGGQVAEVPESFVGTWKGPITEKTTGQPHGTLTAVFKEGKKGADVVTMNTTITALDIEVSCNSVGSLTSGTEKELTLRERDDPDRPSTPGLCTVTTTDVHFTRAADGTLRFRSDERGAGLPYGTLTRSGH